MKPQISIIMGSSSDKPTFAAAFSILDDFRIPYEIRILSAHRTPRELITYVKQAKGKGVKVFIAAAGGAAHLAGVIAAHCNLPVIGVPIKTSVLKGIDSYLSTLQMPAGVPVATMSIGKSGAVNAVLLATQILAVKYPSFKLKLRNYRQKIKRRVLKSK
jgi:5-(carboxyamino)imidazole ribonucleotide mutase